MLLSSRVVSCVYLFFTHQAWELLHKGVGYIALGLGVLAVYSGLQRTKVGGVMKVVSVCALVGGGRGGGRIQLLALLVGGLESKLSGIPAMC